MHSSDSPPSKHHSSSNIALPGAVRMAGLATVERFLGGHFTPSVGSTTSGSHSRRGRGIAVHSAEAAALAKSVGARCTASFTASARADGALLRVLIGACAVQGFPEEPAAADSSGWFIEWHFTPSIGSTSGSSIALPGAVRMAALATVERFIEGHFTPSIGSTAAWLSRCSRGIAVRSTKAAALAENGGARRATSSAASARAGGAPLWVLVGACAIQGLPEELVMADGGGWTPTATPASIARCAELSAASAPMTVSTRNSRRGRVAIVALERGDQFRAARVVALALL
jgi:hypothetical protein